MMRIITGSARGTRLLAPEGLNTRPTSERAKMGIFNILQFQISGRRVLDLFAGSGQMALEALSRGADSALLCDLDENACRCIDENIRRTHMEGRARRLCGDFHKLLRTLPATEPFDLVFLDPPYRSDMITDALVLLLRHQLLSDDAIIVLETDGRAVTPPPSLSILRTISYGKNHFTLLTPRQGETT